MQLHVLLEQTWVLALQHWPPTQSLSEQQPAVQTPWQHSWPAPHWSSPVQAQASLPHWCVCVLQHWPPTQSASAWQHGAQVLPVQQLPSPQSASAQHWPETHAPPQHTWPEPHCALDVQLQAAELQPWVAWSQHWPPVQSASTQQVPGTHTGIAAASGEPASLLDPLPLPLPCPLLVASGSPAPASSVAPWTVDDALPHPAAHTARSKQTRNATPKKCSARLTRRARSTSVRPGHPAATRSGVSTA
jgi:hypothetical protein